MKSVLTTAVLTTLGLAASGASANDFSDVARVISTTPIHERVSIPRQQCHTESVTSHDERRVRDHSRGAPAQEQRSSGGGAVLGAIIGGVIGHQFGNSSGGRDRGTAAGAIVGGIIGNGIERDQARGDDGGYRRAARDEVRIERTPITHDVQRCRVVTEYREEIRGYDVRYQYHGREFSTRLSYDPGSTIPVSVEVRPSTRAPVPSYQRLY